MDTSILGTLDKPMLGTLDTSMLDALDQPLDQPIFDTLDQPMFGTLDQPILGTLGVSANAEAIYRMMLVNPDMRVDELCEKSHMSEREVRGALNCLTEMMLLRESCEEPGRLHAVIPQIGLQALLLRQQADLARRQLEVAQSQASVAQMIAETSHAAHRDTEVILGVDAVQERLELLAREAAREVLTFMPDSAQPAAALTTARRNDARMLERGVDLRTIGLDSVSNDPATLDYARWLTDSGSQFRTAPVLPPRMILADGEVAVVSIHPDNSDRDALYLTSPGIIESLTALFEQVWANSTPLGAARAPDQHGLTAQERALIELLGQGLTDEAAANRLGVSPRTARRMMAGLMQRLGARSRFEAGLKAAQRGWLEVCPDAGSTVPAQGSAG